MTVSSFAIVTPRVTTFRGRAGGAWTAATDITCGSIGSIGSIAKVPTATGAPCRGGRGLAKVGWDGAASGTTGGVSDAI